MIYQNHYLLSLHQFFKHMHARIVLEESEARLAAMRSAPPEKMRSTETLVAAMNISFVK